MSPWSQSRAVELSWSLAGRRWQTRRCANLDVPRRRGGSSSANAATRRGQAVSTASSCPRRSSSACESRRCSSQLRQARFRTPGMLRGRPRRKPASSRCSAACWRLPAPRPGSRWRLKFGPRAEHVVARVHAAVGARCSGAPPTGAGRRHTGRRRRHVAQFSYRGGCLQHRPGHRSTRSMADPRHERSAWPGAVKDSGCPRAFGSPRGFAVRVPCAHWVRTLNR